LLEKADRETAMGEIDKLPEAKTMGEIKADVKWAMTINRVRDNLHLVMAFSPVGEKFRDRFVKFPAIFNMAAIDWFLAWPQEALVETAHQLLDNFKIVSENPEGKTELEKFMGAAHTMVSDVTTE
jgi:dynein heavy chain